MEETKFSLNQTPISTILAWVESRAIAIPEIQRPFVWTSSQVRDLMDSLYQGGLSGWLYNNLAESRCEAEGRFYFARQADFDRWATANHCFASGDKWLECD